RSSIIPRARRPKSSRPNACGPITYHRSPYEAVQRQFAPRGCYSDRQLRQQADAARMVGLREERERQSSPLRSRAAFLGRFAVRLPATERVLGAGGVARALRQSATG